MGVHSLQEYCLIDGGDFQYHPELDMQKFQSISGRRVPLDPLLRMGAPSDLEEWQRTRLDDVDGTLLLAIVLHHVLTSSTG